MLGAAYWGKYQSLGESCWGTALLGKEVWDCSFLV